MAPLPTLPAAPSTISDELLGNAGNPGLAANALLTGVQFWPSYFELVTCYLADKVLGCPSTVIKEFDVYSRDPDQLPSGMPNAKNGWKYFFVDSTAVNGRRETPNGYWLQIGEEMAIQDEDDCDRVVGFVKTFSFYFREDNQETSWKMDQLRLNPDLVEFRNSDNVEMNNFIVCCLRPNDEMQENV